MEVSLIPQLYTTVDFVSTKSVVVCRWTISSLLIPCFSLEYVSANTFTKHSMHRNMMPAFWRAFEWLLRKSAAWHRVVSACTLWDYSWLASRVMECDGNCVIESGEAGHGRTHPDYRMTATLDTQPWNTVASSKWPLLSYAVPPVPHPPKLQMPLDRNMP